MTRDDIKAVLDRVSTWPPERQAELAAVALEIEAEIAGRPYRPTPEELTAIDEAEGSGLASDEEVEAAFRSFRRA